MLLYSARKNIANDIDAYSTLYPATISASASGRSKGARFVSANTEIKNKTNKGARIKALKPSIFCFSTISIRLKEPAQAATGSRSKATETS